MKKKLLALFLMGAMVSSMLAGCGSEQKDTAAKTGGDEAAATAGASASGAAGASGKSAPDWTAYTKLIKEIYKDTDMVDREAKMHEAEDMLMDTGAVMPLYYYNDLYLLNTAFTGDYSNVFGYKYFMHVKKDGKNAKVMRLNLASEPDHLDPALNTTADGGCLALNSFAGLYTYDKDGKLVPELADGEPEVSEDGTQYTVKVKKGLKWSDGSDLNANDFVYSWQRAADPKTGADYAYLFDVFAKDADGKLKVEAKDDNTITFTLAAPCSYMVGLMAFPTFLPVQKKAVEAADKDGSNPGAWAMEAGFVTNGAYTLKSWKHKESMVYVKNPNYYDADNVTADELDFMLSADDTAILAAYQAGNLDFADTVPTGEIKNLKNKPDFHVIPNLGTYYVAFNVNSSMFDGMTTEQASDTRKALSKLIDRQYIIDTIGQTEQKLATSYIPPAMSDGHGGEFKKNDDAYTYPVKDAVGYYSPDVDVDGAVALLKKAGFQFDDNNQLSESTPLHINYLTNDGTGHVAVAQALQQDFSAIGITMDINQEDWQTFLNDRKQGNFDVAREGWLADFDDPINMLDMFLPESGNNDCQLGK